MKNKLVFLVAIIFLIPATSFAAWWNVTDWIKSNKTNEVKIENNSSIKIEKEKAEGTQNTSNKTEIKSNLNISELNTYKSKIDSLEYENKSLKDQVKILQKNLNDLTIKYNNLTVVNKNNTQPSVNTSINTTNTNSTSKEAIKIPTINLILRGNLTNKINEITVDTESYDKLDVLGFGIEPSNNDKFYLQSINTVIDGDIKVAYLTRNSVVVSTSLVKDRKAVFTLSKDDYNSMVTNSDDNVFRIRVDAKPSSIQARITSIKVIDQSGNLIESNREISSNIIKLTSIIQTDKISCNSKGGIWFNSPNTISKCTIYGK